MISVKQLLQELVTSLRNVIAPAIMDPYPKTQAYMAAVILEFVARQVGERADIATSKQAALDTLFERLAEFNSLKPVVGAAPPSEAHLCELIERLYAERETLGEEAFAAANRLVRETLRRLLDQDLTIAGSAQE